MENLIDVDWLVDNFQSPDLVILDASPETNAAALEPYLPELQIEKARRFDLKNVFSDQDHKLPNTLPSPELFEEECQKIGIKKSSRIVVYDNLGLYSSPRVWWMFKIMGHDCVGVLNGGLAAWHRGGHACEEKLAREFRKGDFRSIFQPKLVRSLKQVADTDGCVIDARSADRFYARIPEARSHLKGGHIPNSLNMPFSRLLHEGFLVRKEKLKDEFDAIGVADGELIFSCGSGMTACVLILAAYILGKEQLSLYDGSWSEWGQRESEFIEK